MLTNLCIILNKMLGLATKQTTKMNGDEWFLTENIISICMILYIKTFTGMTVTDCYEPSGPHLSKFNLNLALSAHELATHSSKPVTYSHCVFYCFGSGVFVWHLQKWIEFLHMLGDMRGDFVLAEAPGWWEPC